MLVFKTGIIFVQRLETLIFFMIRNYFIIATRNLKNSLLYSFINVLGLSIGIGCCLILSLFVLDQLIFDEYNVNAKNIYRVVNRQVAGNESSYVGVTQGALIPELTRNFGEIKAATRVGILHESLIVDKKDPMEQKLLAVDPAFFSIFTVSFKTDAKKEQTLSQEGMLISASAAEKLFGKADPVGQIISAKGLADFKVTGVFNDFPTQSHLRGDYIISFSWIEKTQPHALLWSSNSYFSYVLMPENFDVKSFNKKMDTFIHQFTPKAWKSFEYFLQPLLSIHLASNYSPRPMGSPGKIILIAFSTLAAIILLLACFNYMNMATARSAKRAMEVGVRKVMGAYRGQLIGQFLTESILLCTLSFLLGILWADLTIPYFNAFTGFKLSLAIFFASPRLLIGLIVCNLLLATLAGSYPAFFLSKFLPVAVLKCQRIADSGRRLRKGLVVAQFTLTSMLIILALLVFRQVEFMRSKDLGFNKEQLLFFSVNYDKNISQESFKAEMQNIAGVKKITSASMYPGTNAFNTGMQPVNTSEDENIKIDFMFTDHDYIPTLDLRVIAGRNFNANGTDKDKGVIINEKAALALGWKTEEAIGKKVAGFIFSDSLPGEIIGVIKDFHLAPLRKEINPLVIGYSNDNQSYIARLDGNSFDVRNEMQKKATALISNKSFEGVFIDDYLEQVYMSDKKTSQFFSVATIIAIAIGCLGLYALSAYEGEQRLKELGIRKIMGASVTELVVLLSKNFLKLVLISLIVAAPLAYYLGNMWLHTFAYQTSFSAALFIESGFYILLLGWVTIMTQAIKASRLNPVDTLRHE